MFFPFPRFPKEKGSTVQQLRPTLTSIRALHAILSHRSWCSSIWSLTNSPLHCRDSKLWLSRFSARPSKSCTARHTKFSSLPGLKQVNLPGLPLGVSWVKAPFCKECQGTSDYGDKLLGACRNCGQQRGCKVDAGEIKALPPCNSCHWLIWEARYYQPGILFSCHTICKWFSNKWFKRLTHAFWCKLTSLLG